MSVEQPPDDRNDDLDLENLSDGDVLALGRAIVEEMGYGSGAGVLGRWMSHHVAEVMVEAESHPHGSAEAARANDRCRQLVLDLWSHRYSRPHDWPRPATVEIMETLDGLPDPESDYWHTPTIVGQLHEVHYRTLGALTDWLASGMDTSVDRAWLERFGTHLSPAETMLLRRAADAGDKGSAMTSEVGALLRHFRERLGLSVGDEHEGLGVEDASDAQDVLERAGVSPSERLREDHSVSISRPADHTVAMLDVLRDAYVDLFSKVRAAVVWFDGEEAEGAEKAEEVEDASSKS